MRQNSFRLCAALLCAGLVAGCGQQPGGVPAVSPKVQRATIGGVAGAITAKAFDQDMGKGALAGATIGALCDDIGLCQPAY